MKKLMYNDIDVNDLKFTHKTWKWLEWYNSLPADLQKRINYIPYEILEIKKVLPYTLIIAGQKNAFNPTYWNQPDKITRANCYAYSVDIICGQDGTFLQPGEYAETLSDKFINTYDDNAYKNLLNDIAKINFGSVINAEFASQTSLPDFSLLSANQICIALVIAPGFDYHWYIRHINGKWSHKPGHTNATNMDAGINEITDINHPLICKQDYGSGLNYTDFIGYYIITHR